MRTATKEEIPQEAEFMADLWAFVKLNWYADASNEYIDTLCESARTIMNKYEDCELANVIIFGTGENKDGGLIRYFNEKAMGRLKP